MLLLTLAMIIVAYLLGSISSAILVCKMLGLPDPRTTGSNNPGATNVLRISNKLTAATVLFLDILKGTVPVWGAYFLQIEPIYLGIIGVAACLGHMYPIFVDFNEDGSKAKNYYVNESVGLATGFLLNAIHHAGLISLTHTPSPMNFLTNILERPKNERAFLLIPIGYPADNAEVPDITRKENEEVLVYYT